MLKNTDITQKLDALYELCYNPQKLYEGICELRGELDEFQDNFITLLEIYQKQDEKGDSKL